jgi:hypothetical protein
MPFFLFGTSYDSWAFGSQVWSMWGDGLESRIKKAFEDGIVNSDNIDWASRGADGIM